MMHLLPADDHVIVAQAAELAFGKLAIANLRFLKAQYVRARLDQEGFKHVRIVISGGLTPERITYFKEAGAPVDSYAVGSYISGATPIDFTADIKEIDGRPIAKRGRIPGVTESPRLKVVDLAAYREG